ncbi:MAG: hypothetical protein AB2L24_26000 [Mangrovibacterium sp.]
MKIFIFLLLFLNLMVPASPADLKGKVSDFSNYHLEKKENLTKILDSNNFSGRRSGSSGGIIGWFEYDVVVDEPGWYELLIDYNPLVSHTGWTLHLTEYRVDGRPLNDYPVSVAFGRKKAGNIWMDKGLHKFRFENTNWFTQSPIIGYEFKPVETDLSRNIRIDLDPVDDYYGGSYYAVGESFPVNVYTAGQAHGIFTLEVIRKSDRSVVRTYHLSISPSVKEQKQVINLSVGEEGSFFCRYKADGKEISKEEALRNIEFSTIDITTVPVPVSYHEVSRTHVYTIDCAKMTPDYENAESQVITSGIGKYRETGRGDWDYYAYKLPVIQSGVYLVEIDIPDDKQRGIQIQFRERDPVNYIIGPGVETGEPFPNSGEFVTQRYLYWPRFVGEQPRIAVVNVGNNTHAAPAAVKQIRLYKANGPLPALKRRDDGREFAKWFEEPLRWLDPYGARNKSSGEMIRSAENLARTMRYMGATTMFLTADVYGMGMYPSKYRYSSKYTGDPLKMMLLIAQKYGLKVIADISPKQGVLTTKYYNESGAERYQLFLHDKNGNHYNYTTNHYTAMFNPAHPEVQQEIKRKTAELAVRYKNLPALLGVSIRVMNWEQHTMTSFNSLDWGYEPYTGKLFSAYLGIPDPGTPQARYALFTGKYKEQWINWRINVVHKLLKNIRDTCRSVNSAFTVYSTIHSSNWAGDQQAREAGIDNFSLDGFKYINGLYSTGRSSGWQKRRLNLTDPAKLKQFNASRAHLFGFQYFEAGRKNIPNSALGLSGDDSKWISAHLNPAGIYNLESYALALASTDAVFLGNGGNTYFIDPEPMREFLADYILLPKKEFSTLFADSNVVIRELKGNEYLFYLLNTTSQPQRVLLQFSHVKQITRMSSGEIYTPDATKQVEFELKPFHLYSYRANGTGITSVSVNAHKKTKGLRK